MDIRFKANFIEHFKSVRGWALRNKASARLNVIDSVLVIQRGDREIRLRPQYVGRRESGQLSYFDVLDACARGFVGWLPYPVQSWEMSLDKIAFKSVAQRLGLPVPAYALEMQSVNVPFLVKPRRGAFGYGIRGPYSAQAAATGEVVLAPGEYADEFKLGRVARAWYWVDQLVVLEAFGMPSVRGDGVTAYRELLGALSTEVPGDFADLAALQGVTPNDVPPAGKTVVCDYRYVSLFNPTIYANHNLLPKQNDTALVRRFQEAGERIGPRIPGARERQMGFVLDAIVDDDDQPWFLEINSNPQWHPDIYSTMLDRLFNEETR